MTDDTDQYAITIGGLNSIVNYGQISSQQTSKQLDMSKGDDTKIIVNDFGSLKSLQIYETDISAQENEYDLGSLKSLQSAQDVNKIIADDPQKNVPLVYEDDDDDVIYKLQPFQLLQDNRAISEIFKENNVLTVKK